MSDLVLASGCIGDVSRDVFVEVSLKPRMDRIHPGESCRERLLLISEGIISVLGGTLKYLALHLGTEGIAHSIGNNCIALRHLSIRNDWGSIHLVAVALKKCSSHLEILQIHTSFNDEHPLSEKYIGALAQNFGALRRLELGDTDVDTSLAPLWDAFGHSLQYLKIRYVLNNAQDYDLAALGENFAKYFYTLPQGQSGSQSG